MPKQEPQEQKTTYVVTLLHVRSGIGKETRFYIDEEKLRKYKKDNPAGMTREALVLKMVCDTAAMLSAAIEEAKPRLILPK